MAITFQPKSEKELALGNLLQDGDYDFEVLFAKDSTSKKGNPMIELKLGVYDAKGQCHHIFDYLVGAMEAKLRHFADATGLLPQYQAGTLEASQTVGRTGRCRLIIRGDKNGVYADRNEVKDYILRPAKPLPGTTAEIPLPSSGGDDDVPF